MKSTYKYYNITASYDGCIKREILNGSYDYSECEYEVETEEEKWEEEGYTDIRIEMIIVDEPPSPEVYGSEFCESYK